MDLRHQSSAMCIIMLGGEDTHPWSAANVGNPHTTRDVQSIIEKTIIAMIGEKSLIANYSPPQLLIADIPIIGNYLTKALQRENIDLSSVRALFDETCCKFKDIDQENNYFGSNDRIVKRKHFETGSKNTGRENDMALCEKIACARLKKIEGQQEPEKQCDNGDDFASVILKKKATNICVAHTCHCGKRVEQDGLHGLSCTKSAGRFSRHATLNSLIKQALGSLDLPSMLEPRGLYRTDGKRPDGVTMISWEIGKQLVWDVTVVDALAPSRKALHAGIGTP